MLLFKGFYDSRWLIRTYGKKSQNPKREGKSLIGCFGLGPNGPGEDPQNPQVQATLAIKEIELKDHMMKCTQWMMENTRLK